MRRVENGFKTNTAVKSMAENTSKQILQNQFESANKFKWTDERVEDLLKCLGQYKTTMEFKGKDFNSDKPRQLKLKR